VIVRVFVLDVQLIFVALEFIPEKVTLPPLMKLLDPRSSDPKLIAVHPLGAPLRDRLSESSVRPMPSVTVAFVEAPPSEASPVPFQD
jgi:hypothetical protein